MNNLREIEINLILDNKFSVYESNEGNIRFIDDFLDPELARLFCDNQIVHPSENIFYYVEDNNGNIIA